MTQPAEVSIFASLTQPVGSRPSNYVRSTFHVACGAVAISMIRLMPNRTWLIVAASVFAIAAWSMETARRLSVKANDRMMRFFGPVAHAEERHRVNSSTWYVTALLLLATFAPSRASELGVLILALADPAAGFIGRRFGRTALRANRSLEGTLTFLVTGAAAAFAWLSLTSGLPISSITLLAFGGATVGALAELWSTRLDDNFTIPIAAASAVAALQLAIPA
ncbi:MAG: hypothetical protein ABIP39_02015 [Polyangiaceae bacterium]